MVENVYTASDCLALRSYLMVVWPNTLCDAANHLSTFDNDVLGELKKSLQHTPDVTPLVARKLEQWVRQVWRGREQKKVLDFIFREPLEQVPLYVNDALLEPFVRWRLTIAK